MPRNAGPAGSGLLPPGVGGNTDEGDEERDENEGGAPGDDELDLDGVPPVVRGEDDDDEDGDDNDDEGDEGEGQDSLADVEARLEAKFQKKFDRAISKAVRNLERKNGARRPADSDEEEDGNDGPAGAPAGRSSRGGDRGGSSPNVTSIRLFARDVISDEMDGSGKQERIAVKKVIDQIVPLVNWDLVEDETEFVEELVGNLKGVASDLVKTGSDRKVAQLRKAGVLQQRPGQPGSAPQSGNRGQVARKLEQGAAAAGRRFPGGSRSLHSR